MSLVCFLPDTKRYVRDDIRYAYGESRVGGQGEPPGGKTRPATDFTRRFASGHVSSDAKRSTSTTADSASLLSAISSAPFAQPHPADHAG